MLMCESDRREELRKCKELRKLIFDNCSFGEPWYKDSYSVTLREKMWIHTETHGYQFSACKVVCMKNRNLHDLIHIEIYNDEGGIHCSSHLLNSAQLKELARLVADAKLS